MITKFQINRPINKASPKHIAPPVPSLQLHREAEPSSFDQADVQIHVQ